MENLVKQKLSAGGFKFFTSENKGNTRLGEAKQKAIIEAIGCTWTEGVYETTTGKIKKQLLNGNAEFLTKDRETGEYYFG